MFGSLGFPELMMIFAVALIVFGPRRLPEIGRTVAKALNEFRKASNDLKTTLEQEVKLEEERDLIRSVTEPIRAAAEPFRNFQRDPLGMLREPIPTSATSTPSSDVEPQPDTAEADPPVEIDDLKR